MLSSLRKAPETRARGKLDPLVQTMPVQAGRAALQLEVDGEVVPYRQVALSAQVKGRIVSKGEACQAGHYVQRGELLLMIDPRDYDLEVQRTQQLIKQTEVNIEELDVEHANTEEMMALADEDLALQARELERVRSLVERQATSQSAVDTAQRGRIQAVNTLHALRNQNRLLETRRGRFLSEKERLLVDLQRAMLDRQRCEIRAPMDGVIVEDTVEQDDFVQPGAHAGADRGYGSRRSAFRFETESTALALGECRAAHRRSGPAAYQLRTAEFADFRQLRCRRHSLRLAGRPCRVTMRRA